MTGVGVGVRDVSGAVVVVKPGFGVWAGAWVGAGAGLNNEYKEILKDTG